MTELFTRPSLDMEEIQSSSNLITVISPRGITRRSTIQKSPTAGEERGATWIALLNGNFLTSLNIK